MKYEGSMKEKKSMKGYIDLHTHSVKSDGSMQPAELVRYAHSRGLSAIALTDHDSTDGIKEALAQGEESGIEVVPGIEFSVQSDTETHILGYFIDVDNPGLVKGLEAIKKSRTERFYDTHRLLENIGIHLDIDEILASAPNGIVGRAHFAKAMTEKGYTASVKEAFDKYLSAGKPAYSGNIKTSPELAISLIRGAGGKAFLAHLHLTKKSGEQLERLLSRLVEMGLEGIEGYYTDYTPEMGREYRALAEKYSLRVSGGTDFHCKMKPHIEIGTGYGDMAIPYSVLEEMRA